MLYHDSKLSNWSHLVTRWKMLCCRQKTLGHRTNCSKCNIVQGQFCGDCLYMRYEILLMCMPYLTSVLRFVLQSYISVHMSLNIDFWSFWLESSYRSFWSFSSRWLFLSSGGFVVNLHSKCADMGSMCLKPMRTQIGFARSAVGFATVVYADKQKDGPLLALFIGR